MIRSMYSRAALIAGLLAFAALPALAQSTQPSAPAPAAGATVAAPAAKANADVKTGVQKDKKTAHKATTKKQQAKGPAADKAVKSSTITNGNAPVTH